MKEEIVKGVKVGKTSFANGKIYKEEFRPWSFRTYKDMYGMVCNIYETPMYEMIPGTQKYETTESDGVKVKKIVSTDIRIKKNNEGKPVTWKKEVKFLYGSARSLTLDNVVEYGVIQAIRDYPWTESSKKSPEAKEHQRGKWLIESEPELQEKLILDSAMYIATAVSVINEMYSADDKTEFSYLALLLKKGSTLPNQFANLVTYSTDSIKNAQVVLSYLEHEGAMYKPKILGKYRNQAVIATAFQKKVITYENKQYIFKGQSLGTDISTLHLDNKEKLGEINNELNKLFKKKK